MTISDYVMVLAVLLAPLVAVQVQKRIEVFRERQQRKLYVFGNLMATRAARVSPEHVQALNMIDLVFYGRKIFSFRYQTKTEKTVTEVWKKYLDHLDTKCESDELKIWLTKGDDLFVELLSNMSESLGYHFDDVHIKKGIYAPKAHSDQELAQMTIRDGLVDIFSGKKAIPMAVVSFPNSEEALSKQNEVQTKLIEYLEGKRAVKVKIEKDI